CSASTASRWRRPQGRSPAAPGASVSWARARGPSPRSASCARSRANWMWTRRSRWTRCTMAGPDPGAFAALLCDYCLDVDDSEQVLVRSTTLAAPLLLALQGEILRRGAWPLLRVEVPGEASSFYANARDEQ